MMALMMLAGTPQVWTARASAASWLAMNDTPSLIRRALTKRFL